MEILAIITSLESIAPTAYQESYDNAGLITGNSSWDCKGALVTLDVTEEVVLEAVSKNCNLIVAHHPIIFNGLKKINGKNYLEKAVITAIKNDIAIYAIHTNLDNVLHGVNGKIADMLGLVNRTILFPRADTLKKLFTFVPKTRVEEVREAVFHAGAGVLGNYSEVSFDTEGVGSFKAGSGANPFVGNIGERHQEKEIRVEIIFPAYLQEKIITALIKAHPYEEVAYDLVELANPHPRIGSGLAGELPEPLSEAEFLEKIKKVFGLAVIRHTTLRGMLVKKVALCGGAGSFLISKALGRGVDFFLTSDIKYHEFFDANGKLVLADIGHFESEQFTIDLIHDILLEKFPTFAVLKTTIITNPVHYFL
jgi:dinuclear metal center YbgI/SA1388 family protein